MQKKIAAIATFFSLGLVPHAFAQFAVTGQFDITNGAQPVGAVTLDGQGNVFGMTPTEGTNSVGLIYEAPAGGTPVVLYSFGNDATVGDEPLAGLIRDAKGRFYGTASTGGANNSGTVFRLTLGKNGATVDLLYGFQSQFGPDGGYPTCDLLFGPHGSVYGTTQRGGAGGGTVF